MTNFSQQPMRNADGETVNPLTGETVHECARRIQLAIIKHSGADGSRAAARQQALSLAATNMARADGRLQDFYAAVAAHLSDA